MRRFVAVLWVTLFVLPRPSLGLTWTRVEAVPAADVYSIQRHGTTLYAGSSDVVYIGADEGTTWTATASVNPAAAGVESVVPTGGALWAGTYGHGVYRSIDAGVNWQPVNTGLAGLGATHIIEMVESDGKLYAGTSGAGIFALDLATTTQWTSFNAGYPVDTAGGVNDLVLHGTTLVAAAGANGFVYRFPAGATLWLEVAILPPIAPGLLSTDLVVSAGDLLVGTTNGVYRSEDGAQSWTFAGDGLSRGTSVLLASSGSVLFAGVDFDLNNHRLYRSGDRGATWQLIDEFLGVYLYGLEVAGDKLFAARTDGLWWTPLATTALQSSTWGSIKSRFRD